MWEKILLCVRLFYSCRLHHFLREHAIKHFRSYLGSMNHRDVNMSLKNYFDVRVFHICTKLVYSLNCA